MNIDYVLLYNRESINGSLRRLKVEAEALAMELLQMADEIAEVGEKVRIYMPGIVQGRGALIDSLCGQIIAYRESIRILEILKDS